MEGRPDMKASNDRKISILGLAAIFCVNLAYMADLVIIPAADSIYAVFGDAPVWVLNFILSGPQLITIFSALLAPSLSRQFSKKHIIITAFAVFTIAASSCGFILNVYYIALMRAIVGFCNGILMSTAMAFLAELYWQDEAKCSAVMGYYNSSMNGFGIVLPLLAGVLCVRQWNLVFYEYLLGIPILLLMFFTLPDTPPEKMQEASSENQAGDEKLPMLRIVSMLISIVVLGTVFNFATYQSSMYLAENQLGDAAVAGVMSSIGCVAGVVAGLFFGKAYEKLKQNLIIVIYLLLALGYVGISFVLSAFWFGICLFVMGLAYGASMSYYFAYATTFVPESKNSTVTGWITAGVSVGTFLCTYVSSFLQATLGIDTLLGLCPIYAGIAGIGVLMTFVCTKTLNKA